MILDDKPLLPVSHSHSSPTNQQPRIYSPPPASPTLDTLARGLLGNRRVLLLIAALLTYLLVGGGWWHHRRHGPNGMHGLDWRGAEQGEGPAGPPSFAHPGEGGLQLESAVVYEAVAKALADSGAPAWTEAEVIKKVLEEKAAAPKPRPAPPKPAARGPLTELGFEADDVFKLGFDDIKEYQATLEDFLRRHFPPSDSAADEPHSLLNDMRAFFPTQTLLSPLFTSSAPSTDPPIPQNLFQTAPSASFYRAKGDITSTWEVEHPGYNLTFHDNEHADNWVRVRFAIDSDVDSLFADGAEGARGIVAAWEELATPAVLRSDFWRYLVLATEGGIYADTDVECLRPLEDWGEDPSWNGARPDDYQAPSLVVGVEADVGDRADWHEWWPRPLQMSQWTIASARAHPVLIDTLRRVVDTALASPPPPLADGSPAPRLSVMEQTGPGPFTDAVLAYLSVKWGKTWVDLRSLDQDGWRSREHGEWGDTKVLSITGFSPGVGQMGAESRDHPAAMAKHNFDGSWRSQEGAEI